MLKRIELLKNVDLWEVAQNKLTEHESELAKEAFNFLQLKWEGNKITQDYERVKNYSCMIYTLRYNGVILFRRYNEDLSGMQYRYASPLFDDKMEL